MLTSQVLGFCVFVFVSVVTIRAAEINSAENEISARGFDPRTLLEKITSTFMTRSGDGSTSQVLSLNLTNLLILVLLKALIFAAGSVGAGGFKGGYGGYGRSTDDEEFINDTEVLLYLGYLSGSPGNYQCLQNIACHRPEQAIKYAKAGGLLVRAARIVPDMVDVDPAHEQTLIDLKKAAEFGQSGGNCNAQFECANNKN